MMCLTYRRTGAEGFAPQRLGQHDTGLDAAAPVVERAHIVLADFTPANDTGPGAPDVVGVATLARYCYSRPLGLIAPLGVDPPFDWKHLQPVRHNPRENLRAFKQELAELLRAPAGRGAAPLVMPRKEAADPPEIFVAMSFQGFKLDLPDPCAFDFTRF
ncbi:MAG: hypothetical protein HY720_32785 [Planctomycetes bacterium]|nr:hypothetical protein [Planctomycetota bacterium]